MNYVIYHDDCYDGFGAAWVAHQYFTAKKAALVRYQDEETAFIPAKYGDAVPEFAPGANNVYILDFSYPRATMQAMWGLNTLVVLDHHKTAEANCQGLPFCTFDMNKSGAGLAWDHFFPSVERPALVNYIEDRDLWRFALPKSREVHSWIQSYEKSFENFTVMDFILQTGAGFSDAASQGTAILRYEKQKVEEMCKEARFVDIGGHSVPVVNTPYNFGSVVGERLCQLYPEAPFSGYWFVRADGEEQYGLRSTGFDVSEIAKQYGGGGHKQAAGFVKGKVTR